MSFVIVCAAVVVAAIVEIAIPGAGVYHAGWFNVALLAAGATAVALARTRLGRANSVRRFAIVALASGTCVAALACVANGLLAPDNRTVVGAPGQSVRVDELGGRVAFPPADALADATTTTRDVVLERTGRSVVPIGEHGRNVGTFVLRPAPRDVVFVEARDVRGNRLTVTQPSGTAFLSPVLLMQQRQTIAGFNVPVDSFAVPAAHRLVRVVLFTPQEAAMLHGLEGGIGPAILFAVDDENDHPLPHAIDAARSAVRVGLGGLQLRGIAFSYPAVEVIAVPSLPAAIVSSILVLGGLAIYAMGARTP